MNVIDDSWYQKPPGIKTEIAAGGLIVRRHGDRTLVALIREGSIPAFVLPKGHIEAGESLIETAQREIEEESGLSQLRPLADLGPLERLDYSKKHWKITHYFLFATDQIEGKPTDPDMAYQVQWFDLDALPEMFWPEQQRLIEENRDRVERWLTVAS